MGAGEGEQTQHLSTEARRSGDEVEGVGGQQALQQQQQQQHPGTSNETEGKENRKRNVVSLTARHKHNSPRPLLGSKHEAAGGEQKTISTPEFTPLRRCLGTGGDTAKSHFPVLLGAGHMVQKAKGANPSITPTM